MAILLIRIADPASIPLNEFFDFGGTCYALSMPRDSREEVAISLEDFYEADADVTELQDVPVVFLTEKDGAYVVTGWYRSAVIHEKPLNPSLFLTGNIEALSRDVFLLGEVDRTEKAEWYGSAESTYEVVEREDIRYGKLLRYMEHCSLPNTFVRYGSEHIMLDPKTLHSEKEALKACIRYASDAMNDQCQGIRELMMLEQYGKRLVTLNGKSGSGYYYEALACEQMGLARQGLKLINRAEKLEPDAADIAALKAELLYEMGYAEAAAEQMYNAWSMSAEETYLLEYGRILLLLGRREAAAKYLKQITDRQLLVDSGIDPEKLEKKGWFMSLRGFRFPNPFKKDM